MIKEVPPHNKPREKAMRYGVRSLSGSELIALILRSGPKGSSVLETADELLKLSKGFGGLSKMSLGEMCKVKGISKVKALELLACFEISRRAFAESTAEMDVIRNAEQVVRWLQREIGSDLQEKFMVIYLDHRNRIISSKVLFVGTINAGNVYPREIFREALLRNCTDLLLVHNHPGEDPTPSKADLALTGRLQKAGKVMGVRILDHLIVTRNRCLSLKESGFMEEQME
jgi:DNA repair protein RadC